MTEMPPPPPSVQYAPPYPQPESTNPWSIVSLICGIVGCLMITAVAAIVTGIVGLATARPPRGGKGMAITGIILGLLWIGGGVAVVGGLGYVASHASSLATYAAKPVTMQYLNQLAAGDIAGADKIAPGLTKEQQQDLIKQLKPLGRCTDLQIQTTHYENINGAVHFAFSGTAVFEHGTQSIDVETTTAQHTGLTLDRLELK